MLHFITSFIYTTLTVSKQAVIASLHTDEETIPILVQLSALLCIVQNSESTIKSDDITKY